MRNNNQYIIFFGIQQSGHIHRFKHLKKILEKIKLIEIGDIKSEHLKVSNFKSKNFPHNIFYNKKVCKKANNTIHVFKKTYMFLLIHVQFNALEHCKQLLVC